MNRWGRMLLERLIPDPGGRKTRRALDALAKLPRYAPAETDLLGFRVRMADAASFLTMYRDIFERQIYRFDAGAPAPFIVDCGANIGLTVIYFKRLYPDAAVVAFEPDRKIFELLVGNLERAGAGGVTLENKAVWTREGEVEFMAEGADAGRILRLEAGSERYPVPAVRLRDYLDREVHFLKLDIEGAESEVLADCADRLRNVRALFTEYHSFAGEPQTLPALLAVLRDAGFRLQVHSQRASPQPFRGAAPYQGIDMLLNVFAFRE